MSRGLLIVNDGEEASYRHVDNENDSTIIFFEADGKVNADWSVGAAFAVKLRSNGSNDVSQTSESAGGSFEHDQSDIWFAHRRLGTLTFGKAPLPPTEYPKSIFPARPLRDIPPSPTWPAASCS